MSVDLIKQAMMTGKDAIKDYEDPQPNKASTKERTEEQALTEGAEKVHVENNINALDEYLKSTGDTGHHNKAVIQQLFENGKPGHYIARTKTLLEKVGEVLARR